MSVLLILLFLGGITIAFANGANSVFKGVATIYGSGVASYRVALAWGTATTLAGSIASMFLATELLKNFTGAGLVPDTVVASQTFMAAVAVGTGLTVLTASLTGWPISTTHALLGALGGAGATAVGFGGLNPDVLMSKFVLPLALSPFAGIALASALYLLARSIGRSWGRSPTAVGAQTSTVPAESSQRLLDGAHFVSAGLVSFSRGLNDTPKIAAPLLTLTWLVPQSAILIAGLTIAIGGIIAAKHVAETLGHKITAMNPLEGFLANLSTSLLVFTASPLGLPVATTHVSACSLFGIGLITGKGHIKMIASIISAWVITVPASAAVTSIVYLVVTRIFT